MTEVTRILSAIEQGDAQASEQLLPLVYDELRNLAAAKMAHERPGQTLQATALVHEAYLRLVDQEKAQHWNSRGHFFGAAAESMRRILVERVRAKRRLKRGGASARVALEEHAVVNPRSDDERALALDEAMAELARVDPRSHEVIQLRQFAGLGVEESAFLLGLSERTIRREMAAARLWLMHWIRNRESEARVRDAS